MCVNFIITHKGVIKHLTYYSPIKLNLMGLSKPNTKPNPKN